MWNNVEGGRGGDGGAVRARVGSDGARAGTSSGATGGGQGRARNAGTDGDGRVRIGEDGEREGRARGGVSVLAAVISALPIFALGTMARSGSAYGFGAGFALAAVVLRLPLAVLVEYCACELLIGGGASAIAAGFAGTGVALAVNCLARRLPRAGRPLTYAAAFAVRVGCAFVPSGEVAAGLLSAIVAPSTAFVAEVALAPFLRGAEPTRVENVCFAISAAVLAMGAARLRASGFYFGYALAAFAISAAVATYGARAGATVGFALGVGFSSSDFSVEGVAFFTAVGAATAAFYSAPRPISSAAAVVSAVAFKLFFDVGYADTLTVMLSISAGEVAFCLVPKRVFAVLSDRAAGDRGGYDGRLVECETARASEYLGRLSAVFGEISAGLGGETTELTDESAVRAVLAECRGCGRCASLGLDCGGAVAKLCEVTKRKGRASVTDVPFFTEVGCLNAARLISVAADGYFALGEEKRRRREVAGERALAAGFAEAAADILAAAAVKARVKIGSRADEELAIERLAACGIVARGAMSVADSLHVLIGKGEDGEAAAVALGRIFDQSYSVVERGGSGAYRAITLLPRPAFDAVVGASSLPAVKGAGGDGHSLLRLSGGKLVVALCDGMGRGESAKVISERAISLVENCYKAELGDDIIIGRVNELLAVYGDGFAAFDILTCDLNDLSYTLIKLASPASFAVTSGEITTIEGGSLPLGSPCKVNASVYRGEATEGESIVLCSDGITDALGEDGTVKALSELASLSPRATADGLVEAAKSRANRLKRDDMTAIVVRLIRRR